MLDSIGFVVVLRCVACAECVFTRFPRRGRYRSGVSAAVHRVTAPTPARQAASLSKACTPPPTHTHIRHVYGIRGEQRALWAVPALVGPWARPPRWHCCVVSAVLRAAALQSMLVVAHLWRAVVAVARPVSSTCWRVAGRHRFVVAHLDVARALRIVCATLVTTALWACPQADGLVVLG